MGNKVRTWPLRRVESAIMDVVRARGEVSPSELHVENGGEFKDPIRVLSRLARQGLLEKRARGVYALPVPHRERIAAMRERMHIVRKGEHTAPNSLRGGAKIGKIPKGAHLVLGDRAAVPGDVVLVIFGATRLLRIYERAISVPRSERVEALVFSDGVSSHLVSLSGRDEVVVRPVVGFFSRRTARASRLRAEANPPTT